MKTILFNILLKILSRKGVYEMAIIYALLIIKGKKTFSDVPAKLKDQVREILIDTEVPGVIDE